MRRLGAIAAIVGALGLSVETASAAGRLAYVDPAGGLHITRADGSDERKLGGARLLRRVQLGGEIERRFRWPNWSPDGSRILAFGVTAGPEGLAGGVYLFDVESGRIVDRFEGPALQPIYALWDRRGRRAGILLQDGPELALATWPNKGRGPMAIARGIPLFFDWKPSGDAVVVNSGGDLRSPSGRSVRRVPIGDDPLEVLSDTPAAFGPPTHSPDGRWLAFAEVSAPGRARLVLLETATDRRWIVSEHDNRLAFSWSPKGRQLAVADAAGQGRRPFPVLFLLDVPATMPNDPVQRPSLEPALTTPITAFFWSPDGRKVFVTNPVGQTGTWRGSVHNLASGAVTDIGVFAPTASLVLAFRFFDQAALSRRLWSPDSRYLVLTGAAGKDLDNVPNNPIPKVYVVDTTTQALPQALANGDTASWSPN